MKKRLLFAVLGMFMSGLSIQSFGQSYEHSLSFGTKGSADGQFNGIHDLAVHPTQDKVYIVDNPAIGKSRIHLFSKAGSFIKTVEYNNSGNEDNETIKDIVIGPDGFVYVNDEQNYDVLKYDDNLNYQGKAMSEANFKKFSPDRRHRSLAIDSEGNFYFVVYYTNGIHKYDKDGNYISKFIGLGFNPHKVGLYFNEHDSLYLAHPDADGVLVYNKNGQKVNTIGTSGEKADVTRNDQGELLVLEGNGFEYYDASGNLIGYIGGAGTSDGRFHDPVSIDFDPVNKDIFILDRLNHRIQVFSKSADDIPLLNEVSGFKFFDGSDGNTINLDLSLVDKDTTIEITDLPDGLNFEAIVNGEVEKVEWEFKKGSTTIKTNTDESAPFTLYPTAGYTPETGTFTLSATPYIGATAGTALTITFEIINSATPDFNISLHPNTTLNVAQGSSVSASVDVSIEGGWDSPVEISFANNYPDITKTVEPGSFTSNGSGVITFDIASETTTGFKFITVLAKSNGKEKSKDIKLQVFDQTDPDYDIILTPSAIDMDRNEVKNVKLHLEPKNGFTGTVNLSAWQYNMPNGLLIDFEPAGIGENDTCNIRLETTESAATGTHYASIISDSETLDKVIDLEITVTAENNNKSSNANLSNISLSEGSLDPVFVSTTYAYSVMLPSNTASVPEVDATKADANASISINQAVNISGTQEERTATITVTAEDGTTQKTYQVVYSLIPEQGKDASLSSLTLDNGTLEPAFAAGIENYTATLPQGTTDVPVVSAETSDANAAKTINQATSLKGTETERTATVEVTSEDSTVTKTYSVVFSVESGTFINNTGETGIKTYPNPVSDMLTIHSSGMIQSVSIYDLGGKAVKQTAVAGNTATIDVSGLDAGMYLVGVRETSGKMIMNKIIKQ